MSCACEHKKMGREHERIYRLAKAFARMEDILVAIYKNHDGTYGFSSVSEAHDKEIVEYVTQY